MNENVCSCGTYNSAKENSIEIGADFTDIDEFETGWHFRLPTHALENNNSERKSIPKSRQAKPNAHMSFCCCKIHSTTSCCQPDNFSFFLMPLHFYLHAPRFSNSFATKQKKREEKFTHWQLLKCGRST